MSAISSPYYAKKPESHLQNIDPEDEPHFNNVTPYLERLKQNITEKTLEEAFCSFKTLYKHFRLDPNLLQKHFPNILDCFEKILFCCDIDQIDPSLYEVLKKNGDVHLRDLINDLDYLPIDEKIEKKIGYLLWIAKTEDKNKKPLNIVLPYYVHILILSKGRFSQECRDNFLNVYERFLSAELPNFEYKLKSALPNNLEAFEAVYHIFGHFESWGISPKILRPYLKTAQDAIVSLPPQDKKKALQISTALAHKINVISRYTPESERLSPLETHLQKLHNYRQSFLEAFEACYHSCFTAKEPPPFIFDSVLALQNHLFENFKTFYQETLTQNSPFSFPLAFPPLHEIRLTGSLGRKEPTPYSDLELFILIEQKSWISTFINHLNRELEKRPQEEAESSLSIKLRGFEYLEKLPKEEKESLNALQEYFQKAPSKEEKPLSSKSLIQKRFIKLLKDKIRYHFDSQGETPSLKLKEEIRNILTLLRHPFEINAEKPPNIIEVLAKKGLFTQKTADLLNDLLRQNDLEGAPFAHFRQYLHLLNLTCSSFGEGPPPSQIGLEEKEIKKGLFLDLPEEGASFLCNTPEEYAVLQTRRGCYNLEGSIPFEYSLLQSTPLETTSLSKRYQDALHKTLDAPLPKEETNPGMETLRHKIALSLLAFRVEAFQGNFPNSIDPKKDLIQNLHYPLTDLAFYFGIEEVNTLEIITSLIERQIFTKESGLLLKEAVAFIYMIRIRCQTQGKEKIVRSSEPENLHLDAYQLTNHEKKQLDIAYFLAIKPLQYKLQKISEIHTKNLQNNFEILPRNPLEMVPIDLIQETLQHALDHPPQAQDLIRLLSTYLLKTNASLERHKEIYEKLSKRISHEPLRVAYLEPLKGTPFYSELSFRPNVDGFRYSTLDKEIHLLEGLIAMTTPDPHQEPLVKVTSSQFETPRYLKSAIAQTIIDGKNLRNHYEDSTPRHSVAKASLKLEGLDPYHIHFKQKPCHPLMEYAIHTLHERIHGRGTPAIDLLRFEIEGEAFPVLASTTLGSVSLEQGVKNKTPLDSASLTEQLILALLTKPGDGRFSNYRLTEKGDIDSIDNDISFVEPTTRRWNNRKIHFSSILFCLEGTLNEQTLENFCELSPDIILYHWAHSLEKKEQELHHLFSQQERKKLYEEDSNNQFHTQLLLKKGTLIALYLQWVHLRQSFLELRRDQEKRSLPLHHLLKNLTTLNNKDHCDKNLVGDKIFKAYEEKKKTPLHKRLEEITKEKESLPSPKAQEASLGKTPTFEEVEQREKYGIEQAKEEILVVQLEECKQEVSLMQDRRVIYADFRKVSSDRASLMLHALHCLLHYQNPPERITLIGTEALNRKTLAPFLQDKVTHLNISHCEQITAEDLLFITKQCPHLKTLYASRCTGIKTFEDTRVLKENLLLFPELEELHLEECNLKTIQINAPHLKELIGKKNPSLKTLKIHIPFTATITLEKEYSFPEGMHPFGPREWETHFGNVGPIKYPDFPTLIDTLNSPCIFWPDKKVYETHLLVLIPETVNGNPFHLDALEELIKSPKAGNETQHSYYDNFVKEELGKKSEGSHWALMTRDVIPNSRNETYKNQKDIVANHADKSRIPYKLPTALEAATAILMEHVQTGTRLYSDSPLTYTRCQEMVNRWPVAIGAFGASGVSVRNAYGWFDDNLGASALRKFR